MPTFPADFLAYGFRIEPEHSTTIVVTKSGHEFRNRNWNHPLHRFRVPLEMLDDTERTELLDFVTQMGGPARAFDFTDPVSNITRTCRFEDDRASIETRFFNTHYWPDLVIREVR